MKFIAVIANILVPGVGSFFVGKAGAGIAQLLIWSLGLMITLGTFGIGVFIGAPMMGAAWIWAIITATSEPTTVTIIDKREG
ncbi:hypothetical protein [Tateyamaria sp. SN3-11]|uniref:hypothetical protein n=1 Tax=Tateyamaria sp. SN3-11 TaxID=3092147 RepID=UPI0039EB0F57